jgi:WD40 repeat protein
MSPGDCAAWPPRAGRQRIIAIENRHPGQDNHQGGAVMLPDPRALNMLVLALVVLIPAAQIDGLIWQLGSNVFAEREAAAAALEKIGEPALDSLLAARENPDPEIRRRVRFAIEAIESGHSRDPCREIGRFNGHRERVSCVAFSPDGRFALSGGAGADQTLLLWEVSTGKTIHSLDGHRQNIRALAISPDGRHAVSASQSETILWDLATGTPRRRIEWGASALAFFPNGRQFAANGWVFEVAGGGEKLLFGSNFAVADVAVSTDG